VLSTHVKKKGVQALLMIFIDLLLHDLAVSFAFPGAVRRGRVTGDHSDNEGEPQKAECKQESIAEKHADFEFFVFHVKIVVVVGSTVKLAA
jgi:hypothetical protein